jgi:hypothetical protein
MAQQTAVEWFVNSVFGKNGLIIYSELIEKAKAMEKEQIVEAAADHCYPTYELAKIDAEEYYNKTFKLEVK